MRGRRGKEVEAYSYFNNDDDDDEDVDNENYDGSEDQTYSHDQQFHFPQQQQQETNNNYYLQCKKHPSTSSSSPGGICAVCLADRLVELVCSQCGEQKLSSHCSCSEDMNMNKNSNSSDAARMSFLLENDLHQHQRPAVTGFNYNYKQNYHHQPPRHSTSSSSIRPPQRPPDFAVLRRSNSSCIVVDAGGDEGGGGGGARRGFWKIGKLFRKKNRAGINNYRDRDGDTSIGKNNNNNINNYDSSRRSEACVSDMMGLQRSRSLCSFRGGGNNNNYNNNNNTTTITAASNGAGFPYYCDDSEESAGYGNSYGGGGSGAVLSAARASSVSAAGFMTDSAKRSCFSESEARISNFDVWDRDLLVHPQPHHHPPAPSNSISKNTSSTGGNFFAMREVNSNNSNSGYAGDFCGDDPKFIDLKLDFSSSSTAAPPPENQYPAMRRGGGFGSMRVGRTSTGGLDPYDQYGRGGRFGNYRCPSSSTTTATGRFSNVGEGDQINKCKKSSSTQKVLRWFFNKDSSSNSNSKFHK